MNHKTKTPSHHPDPAHPRAMLRLLATSDLHMHLLGFDYYANRPDSRIGLTQLLPLIEKARAQVANCLLFDNGDTFQGNPLADFEAMEMRRDSKRLHPAVTMMNRIVYDATTLGNHDFSFGPGFLRRLIAQADWPIAVCNATLEGGTPWQPYLILERDIITDDGQCHPIRIGVLGTLPPQTPLWEAALQGVLHTCDMIEAATQAVSALQARNADLIVALAHSGIGQGATPSGAENAAHLLAAIPGIDAVVAGHTHIAFPGPDTRADDMIDPVQGRLCGKPAVMPGFWGSHLGVIDLSLRKGDDGWHIVSHQSALWRAADGHDPETATTPGKAASAICAPARRSHAEALRHLSRRIARCDTGLNSHFALLGHDGGLRLTARAMRWYLRRSDHGCALPDLPVLCAVSPFRSGGRGGPAHYTNVPAGRLSRRHLSDLYQFPNTIAGLMVSGADLKTWLERAAQVYAVLGPDTTDKPLIRDDFPGYNVDLIDGLDYRIDLSAPPDPSGDAGRVRDITCLDRPVAANDRFILLTNSYRVSAAGPYGDLALSLPDLALPPHRVRDILHHYLRRQRRVTPMAAPFFTLSAPKGSTAFFDTAPDAAPPKALSRILSPGSMITPEGFGRFRLRF